MSKIALLLYSFFTYTLLLGQIDIAIYQVQTNLYKTNTISGALKTLEWKSESMQEVRKIAIYEPVGFHKDSTYSVVMVTDNQAEALANALEPKMINKKIQPFLIVGINNREPQKIDSIFGDNQIDFRSSEMLGDKYVSSNEIDYDDSVQMKVVFNRVPKFHDFIVNEVSSYMEEHYNVHEQSTWTLGGFSNGGFLAANIGLLFPKSFGNIIAMSPGGDPINTAAHNNNTDLKFFICAGIAEKGFHKRSLELANTLKENKFDFEHKSYQAGHDYNMWLTYYVETLSIIYKTK